MVSCFRIPVPLKDVPLMIRPDTRTCNRCILRAGYQRRPAGALSTPPSTKPSWKEQTTVGGNICNDVLPPDKFNIFGSRHKGGFIPKRVIVWYLLVRDNMVWYIYGYQPVMR